MGWTTTNSQGQQKVTHPISSQPSYATKTFRTTTQSISNVTDTPISFDSVQWDFGTQWSAGNPTRLTAGKAGLYQVEGNVKWGGAGGGRRGLYFAKNGNIGPDTFANTFEASDSISSKAQHTSGQIYLLAGDYIEAYVFQDSGGPVDLIVDDDFAPSFGMALVSPSLEQVDVGAGQVGVQQLALDTWGPVARTQGVHMIPDPAGDALRDDGAGNLTLPDSNIHVMNPAAGSFFQLQAGTYALGAWGYLYVDLPPTGTRGTIITPQVGVWSNLDRDYDNPDRFIIAQRFNTGRIKMSNGQWAWEFSNAPSGGAYRGVNAAIAGATWTHYTLNNTLWDTDGMVNLASNVLDINTPGKYRVRARAFFAAASSNTSIGIRVRKNNFTTLDEDMMGLWATGGAWEPYSIHVDTIVELALGDTIQGEVYTRLAHTALGTTDYTMDIRAHMVGL